MSVLIGEKVTKYWQGEEYKFMRISKGVWRRISKYVNGHPPKEVLQQLGD